LDQRIPGGAFLGGALKQLLAIGRIERAIW
jgi:hypothetical protein